MYDNDLFNQMSDAFHDMLDNLDKGLRDGVGNLKDMKKSVERNGIFGEKKEQRKTSKSPFSGLKNISAPSWDATLNKFRRVQIPADVIRNNGVLTINAELPGYEKSQIHVDYREGEIIIRAERVQAEYDASATVVTDRRFGKVERVFKVGKIDVETVRAAFNNGVLTITCSYPNETSGINIE